MDEHAQETLAVARATPNIELLQQEFRRAGMLGDSWDRVRLVEDTRLARWDSQTDDGRKHDANQPEGQTAFPFEGASDMRCYQADAVVNECVAVKTTAFWRADVRSEGMEASDTESAANGTTFMYWLVHQKLRESLEEEVELSAQYEEWYGWTGLHVTWDREITYRPQRVTLDQLTRLAQGAPPEHPLAAFPVWIADPGMEDAAVSLAQDLYAMLVSEALPEGINADEIRPLSGKAARRAVRALRDEGLCELPLPRVSRNQPCITALKPWRDIILPTDTTDIQSARAVFIRRLMSEAELLTTPLADGWDRAWVEAARQTKGRYSEWANTSTGTGDFRGWNWTASEQRNELIEVIWAYVKQADEDGVLGTYYTVFSPHVTTTATGAEPLYAKHGLLPYPETVGYPVVLGRRERLDRMATASRGVPEILLTSQREEKVQRDALADLASIKVMPPITVFKASMGQRWRFGPAVQNEVTVPGREPRFMDVPGEGVPVALELIQLIRASVNRYFGLFSEDVPPALNQVLMEPRVNRFLRMWGRALQMAWQMTTHFNPDLIRRVTGHDALPEGEMDFVFHFDTAQLNPDLMAQKLEAFSNLLPEDAAGTIDRDRWVRVKARMIDPVLARELVQPAGPASQRMYRETKRELVDMLAGSEPEYSDASNDPTAPVRARMAMDVIGRNPKMLAALDPEVAARLFPGQPPVPGAQPDPLFSALVDNYFKNLKQGAAQQRNKQVGRIGVNPVT